jgi:hypothetical protein
VSCGPKTPARPKERKGIFFVYTAKNGKILTGSRKPPFYKNIDFSEQLNGWH